MTKAFTLFACLLALQHNGVHVVGFTYYSCSANSPLVHIGTRGTIMHMLNAKTGTKVDYSTSACSRVYCRRLKSGIQHWTEQTLSDCQSSENTCYILDDTNALPIVSSKSLPTAPGCEQIANVGLVGGLLVTPSAPGNFTCNTFGRSIWMYASTTFMDPNEACPNFNQCTVDNGWCAAGTNCTDVTGPEGHRTCGGCPSGSSGNGDGLATCPLCSDGFYSVFSAGISTTMCVACTKTCPAATGVTSACTNSGRSTDRACGPCPGGKFNNGSSLLCTNCSTSCPAGMELSAPCNVTSNRVCAPCAPGTYQNGSACTNCSTSCPVDMGVSVTCNTTSDRVCAPCAAGKFQGGESLTCSNSIVVPYSNATNLTTTTFGGVQVNIPRDTKYGENGSFVITLNNGTLPTVAVTVSIEYFGTSNSAVRISDLEYPIRFILPLVAGIADQIAVCEGQQPILAVPECKWQNTTTKEWSSSGCQSVNVSSTHVECGCKHLTDFSFVVPDFNRVPLQQVLALTPENLNAHPGGIITVMTVLAIFSVVLVLSIRKDVKERREVATLALKKHAKWDREDAQVRTWKRRWLRQFRIGLQTQHTWGSLLFRRSGTTFRSVDRTVVTLALVLILMSMSARFHERNQTFLGQAEVVIYSVLASLLASLLLPHVFTQTGELGFFEQWQEQKGLGRRARCLRYRFAERWRWVWYGVVLLCALGMILYILSIGLMFDQNPWYFCRGQTTFSWVSDFVLSYAITVLLVEPLKIVLFISGRELAQHTRMTGLTRTEAIETTETTEPTDSNHTTG